MNNHEFLRTYFMLLGRTFLDAVIDMDFALVGYSAVDKTAYWNQALVGAALGEDQYEAATERMRSLNRRPAFYFESSAETSRLATFLETKGCKRAFEDAWMFYEAAVADQPGFGNIVPVRNEANLETFLHTLDACYRRGDPQNPYGELGEYLEAVRRAWNTHRGSGGIEHFLAEKNGRPVAVATLGSYDGVGYISNVGSLPQVRGGGFGKLVSLWCVRRSQERGNVRHCLATEEGGYPYEFYKKVGFKHIFTARAYAQ